MSWLDSLMRVGGVRTQTLTGSISLTEAEVIETRVWTFIGSPGADVIVTAPMVSGLDLVVVNALSDGHSITLSSSTGSSVTVEAGDTSSAYCTGTGWVSIRGQAGPAGATGATGPTGPTGPAGAALARPYPKDADDLHVWALDEMAGTSFANSGSSSLALTASGSVSVGVPGMWGSALSLWASTTAGAASADTTDDPSTGHVTASIWVWFVSSLNSNIFCRFARPTSTPWSSPYVAWRISRDSGVTKFSIARAPATYNEISAAGVPEMLVNQWNHVGLSYDGTTLRGYVNGQLAASGSYSGAIDYTTAAPYVVGTDRATFTNVTGHYADARVASVARDAAWFRAVYRRGLYGT